MNRAIEAESGEQAEPLVPSSQGILPIAGLGFVVESSGFGVADSGVVRASTHSRTPLDAASRT